MGLERAIIATLCIVAGCEAARAPSPADVAIPLDTAADRADTDDASSEDTVAACLIGIASLSPAPGAVDVGPDTIPELTFTAPLPEGEGWELRVDGVEGTLTLSMDRQVGRLIPAAPLSPDLTYTVHATVCGDTAEHSFTTRPAPIDPAALADQSWQVSPADVSWACPASGPLLLDLFRIGDVTLHVAVEGGVTQLLASYGYPCVTVPLGALDLSANPDFALRSPDLRLPWPDGELRLIDASLTGRFRADQVERLSFVAVADLRHAGPELCALSARLGSPCQPCDDGVVACLDVANTVEPITTAFEAPTCGS